MILSAAVFAFSLSVASLPPAINDQPVEPDVEFRFSTEAFHAGQYRFQRTEAERRFILKTLRSPKRDAILERLVPTVEIGGDKWFDLRGITVFADELPAGAVLSRICWDGARFVDVSVDSADFSFTLLRGTAFENCKLPNASFHQAFLECASFTQSDLHGASFKLVRFGHDEAQFRFCNLDGAAFDNSRDLRGIYHGSAVGATFVGAALHGSHFTEVALERASFRDTDLTGADFFGSAVAEADFTRALLAEAKLNFSAAGASPRFNATRLLRTELDGIDLKNVDVNSFDWSAGAFEIGEEIRADAMKGGPTTIDGSSDLTRAQLYSAAEVIYRTLAHAYRRLGYSEEYLQLRYRSLEARRKLLELRPGTSSPLEKVWLTAWHDWDHYGTSLEVVSIRYVVAVLLFAAVYLLAWTVFQRPWALWRKIDTNGQLVASTSPSPAEEFRVSRGFRRKLGTTVRLAATAILFSFVATFMFVEKVIDIRRFVDLIQVRDERLIAVNTGRFFVAAEALLGALFLYSIVTRFVLLLPD